MTDLLDIIKELQLRGITRTYICTTIKYIFDFNIITNMLLNKS